MLTFTNAGVVAAPTALQIRVTRQFPGRVPAGAPEPLRALDPAEVLANIEHFTLGQRGPRTRPVDALVLSGVSLHERPDLAHAVDRARDWGVARVTVHLGPTDPGLGPLAGRVDAVALRVSDPVPVASIRALASAGVQVTAVVVLDAATLAALTAIGDGLIGAAAGRVVLTWPLTGEELPPRADDVGPALGPVVQRLAAAGIEVGIKGLPACKLAPGAPVWRSANRWYVDAAHQCDQALLFFPGVVRLAKQDVCRFCALDGQCEGVPAPWLRAGLAGALEPVRP